MKRQIDVAEARGNDSDKYIFKMGDLNKLVFENIVLSINYKSIWGIAAFCLIKNCKHDDFPKQICNWNRKAWWKILAKYIPDWVGVPSSTSRQH